MQYFDVSGQNGAGSLKDVCSLTLESGPCMALMPRYGFDENKDKCVEFNYGGCQGNKNNFETKAECEQQCQPRKLH